MRMDSRRKIAQRSIFLSNFTRMKTSALSFAVLTLSLASCTTMRSPIAAGAKPVDHGAIGATEGPAWKDGNLYFTDAGLINRMDAKGRTGVFRDKAHAHAANGLMFDRQGRLVACESGARRVTRTEKDGSITVLADRFEGKRFNSPNDLCMDSKGNIYFTDPRYGPRDGMEIMELLPDDQAMAILKASSNDPVQQKWCSVEGVYRINRPKNLPPGLCSFAYDVPNVTRIQVPGVERPNGILISPDDRYLYICDNNNNNDGGSRKLLRFDLDKDGMAKPGSRKVIFDWKASRGPDGMKMDQAGRLYVAGGTNKPNEYENTEFKAGCYILSPSGKLLDFIPTAPDEACNCAFGGKDLKTLFITSGKHLWSIPVDTPGRALK